MTSLVLYLLFPATLADCDREWRRYRLPRARYAIVVNQPEIVKLPDGRRALGYRAECARSKPTYLACS